MFVIPREITRGIIDNIISKVDRAFGPLKTCRFLPCARKISKFVSTRDHRFLIVHVREICEILFSLRTTIIRNRLITVQASWHELLRKFSALWSFVSTKRIMYCKIKDIAVN